MSLSPTTPDTSDVVAELLELLRSAGGTLAVAESLTGGAVVAAVVAVPGASDVLRGGVVAYATDLKVRLLGVDADLLRRAGAVHPHVARQMAAGAARLLGAEWAVATTGVAGPGPQGELPAGTVHVAVHGPVCRARALQLDGDRDVVRRAATGAALELLLDAVRAGAAPREAASPRER